MELRDDRVDIAEVAYRYAYAVDRRDWDAVAACFTEDASADYNAPEGLLVGRDAIVASIERRVGGDDTHHFTGMPVIDVQGDYATARFSVIASHRRTEEGRTMTSLAGASYQDELVRVADGWVFSKRNVRRLWTFGDDIFPPTRD